MYPHQSPHPTWGSGSMNGLAPRLPPSLGWPEHQAPPPGMMMMVPQAAWGRPPGPPFHRLPPHAQGPGLLGAPWSPSHWPGCPPAPPPTRHEPAGFPQTNPHESVPERNRGFQDWPCLACQRVNFQRRTHCLSCGRARDDVGRSNEPWHEPPNPPTSTAGSMDPAPPLPPPVTVTQSAPTPPPPLPAGPSAPPTIAEGKTATPPSLLPFASEREYRSILAQEKQLDTMYDSWTKNFERWKMDHRPVMNQPHIQKQLMDMNALKDKMLLRRENLKRKRLDMFNPPPDRILTKTQGSTVKRSRWSDDAPAPSVDPTRPSQTTLAATAANGAIPGIGDGIPGLEDGSSIPPIESKEAAPPQPPPTQDPSRGTSPTTEELSEQDRENIAKAIKALSRGSRPESFQPKPQLQSHQFSWTKSKDESRNVSHQNRSHQSHDSFDNRSDTQLRHEEYSNTYSDWRPRHPRPSTSQPEYQRYEDQDDNYFPGEGPPQSVDARDWNNPGRQYPHDIRGLNFPPEHGHHLPPKLPPPMPQQQNRDPFVQRIISDTITPVPATKSDRPRQSAETHWNPRNRPHRNEKEGNYDERNWDNREENPYWQPNRRVIDYNQRSTDSPVKAVDYGHGSKSSFNSGGPSKASSPFSYPERQQPPSPLLKNDPAKQKTPIPEPQGSVVSLEDLIDPPGRYIRPPQIVIIFRGLPGSGKTQLVKDIKTKEANLGSDPPRILAIDEYFECDGEYEYEPDLEPSFRQSLVKSFKKQIDDGYFSFIMVDCINDKTEHYEEMWSYAKQKGFEVYIGHVEADAGVCASRNVHKRTRKEIDALLQSWQPTPAHMNKVTLLGYFQDQEIDNVDMELEQESPGDSTLPTDTACRGEQEEEKQDEETKSMESPFQLSKWEVSDKLEKMAQLDGVSSRDRKRIAEVDSIEDWLELDNFKQGSGSGGAKDKNGKKRVRWADIEEQRESIRMREVGFVVGGTNWNRMMNPGQTSSSALTKTKIIPNRYDL